MSERGPLAFRRRVVALCGAAADECLSPFPVCLLLPLIYLSSSTYDLAVSHEQRCDPRPTTWNPDSRP